MTDPTPARVPRTAKARRANEAAEYASWTAVEAITSSTGALAYGPGYPVPAANVDEDGRVVLRRHQCEADHPETGERCDQFNDPIEWAAPGAARAG